MTNVKSNLNAAPRFEALEDRRLCAAGDPDPSFSLDGRTTVNFLGGQTAFATDAAVQRDGKTVVVGFATSGTTRQFAIARLNFDGTLDTSFDGDGLVQVPVSRLNCSQRALSASPRRAPVRASNRIAATDRRATPFSAACSI